jgi:DNA invertase Pin-like site-specific DNA recombinase
VVHRADDSPKRAAIYARISLDRAGAGLGVDRQVKDCRALVESRGWALTGVYDDNDISAYSGKHRPGYRALLRDMRAKEVDVVVAWHTDRLHRSPRELEEWIEVCETSGVMTVTVRAGELDLSTAAGRMVARMLGAAARHESEQKSERIRRARQQAAEAGRAHGPLGYGYRDDHTIDPQEAAVVREVADRLLAGETLYAIASDLNTRKVPTPGTGRWTHVQVRAYVEGRLRPPSPRRTRDLVRRMRADGATHGQVAAELNRRGVPGPTTSWRPSNLRTMIRRGVLCGWREWEPGGRGGKGELIAEGDWPPILSRATTSRVRAILDDPERKVAGRHPRYLLSTILRCGRCGAPMGGTMDRRSGTRRYGCAQQPGLERCGRTAIVAQPVDDMVTEAVLQALTNTQLRPSQRRVAQEEDVALEELEAARRVRDELIGDRAAGRITTREWEAARTIVESRVKKAEAMLGNVTASVALTGVPTKRKELDKWWGSASLDRKRAVIKALIDKVVVQPRGKGGNTFDPSRVEPPVWRF